ncbi:MAG: ParA family protein [Silicimonas sp.]|nr:ParA family protein [Silicimonas sp.]NND17375.1 ParA family protein [Silicimonas sp.]NND21113.1 ParA family protein [Silicimonas sp.]NND40523.1 ParA family protein [Silicimonas sp.]NNL72130.1 ParA family protein [Silicimonas sp.]
MAGKVITVAQQKGGAGKTTIAANLAVALSRKGKKVALLDTDPQGSLGRWFMARRDIGEPGIEFSTASAWGVSYECDKLRKTFDYILVDTPPKIDSDLKPAIRESDLVIVPVSASQVDVWATEGVLDLAQREKAEVMVVLNRAKAGTRVAIDVDNTLKELGVTRAKSVLGHRVAFPETMGVGKGVMERGKGAWAEEFEALTREVMKRVA